MNLPNLGPTIKRENIVVTMRAFLNSQTHNRAWLTVTHSMAVVRGYPTGRLNLLYGPSNLQIPGLKHPKHEKVIKEK